MNLEQIGLLGIGVFAIMALAALFNTARSIKQVAKGSLMGRPRRLIGSPSPAEAVARSVVLEVRDEYESDVAAARETRTPSPALEKALADARNYYLSRVDPRYRTLFSSAVSEIIYDDSSDPEPSLEE